MTMHKNGLTIWLIRWSCGKCIRNDDILLIAKEVFVFPRPLPPVEGVEEESNKGKAKKNQKPKQTTITTQDNKVITQSDCQPIQQHLMTKRLQSYSNEAEWAKNTHRSYLNFLFV